MLYYRAFEVVPDFAAPPTLGVQANPAIVDNAPAARLVRWLETQSLKTTNARFILRGPLENQVFRDFVWTHRAAWRPFYWPSWQVGFTSETVVSVGTTEIDIDTNLAEYLTEDRPDTYGRTLFFYSPKRELFFARVLSSLSNGDGTFSLQIDAPFTFGADLSECVCGFAWLARFANNEMTYRQIAPDAVTVSAGLLEVRNRANTENENTLEGEVLGGSKVFRTLYETDEDSPRADMRTAAMIGPETYGVAQGENFTKEWAATLEGGTVTLTDGASQSEESAIYDGGDDIRHLSGAFDSLSNEALAWQKDFNTIRLVWHVGAGTDEIEWTGRTPVLFNNFAVNGLLLGGESDILAYYLKTGESKLFARLQSEDFATEHTISNLPVMPLGLIENQVADSRHQLKAVSTRQTLLTLQSDKYAVILGLQRDSGTGEAGISGGNYELIAIDPPEPIDTETATGQAEISGNYRNSVVEPPGGSALTDEGSGTGATGEAAFAVGNYLKTAVDSDSVDSGTGETEVSGNYEKTAKDGSAEESATGTTQITGVYES